MALDLPEAAAAATATAEAAATAAAAATATAAADAATLAAAWRGAGANSEERSTPGLPSETDRGRDRLAQQTRSQLAGMDVQAPRATDGPSGGVDM
jgi:hypothetical protein